MVRQSENETKHKKILPDHFPLLYKGEREIPGLQILKFFCAILVILIHTPSCGKAFVMPITRIAVPIFFMITGYFVLGPSGDIPTRRLRKTIFKTIRLFLIVGSVYIIYNLSISSRNPEIFHKTIQTFLSLKSWLRLLTFGTYPAEHLWYLVSLIQAVLVIMLIYQLKLAKWLWILIPLGFAANLLYGKYNFIINSHLVPNNLLLARNSITTALPCIILGMGLRRYEHLLPSTRTVIFTTMLCLILLYIENITLYLYIPKHPAGDIVLLTVPCAVGIFILFLRFISVHPAAEKLGKLGKHCTLNIYVWHILIYYVASVCLSKLNIHGFDFIIVTILSVCLAVFLYRTNLKRFYS